jgi:glycosyltransferase involved in cell wall biosynthesis
VRVDAEVPAAIHKQLDALADSATTEQTPPGVMVRSARVGPETAPIRAATWWWVDGLDDVTFETLKTAPGEAVLAGSEEVRARIENVLPSLVSDVWLPGGDPESLQTILERYYPNRTESYRLGVIGYNLKFALPIVTNLIRNPGIDALIDEWPVFAAKPTATTDEVIARSDIVLCEWCGPNAVYASRHKRPGQRLAVRLHRFELETDHWRQIDAEQVDMFVTVGEHYRELVLERTGWPAEKVTVIGNQVDDAQLRRSKLEGYRFNLGMLGASSSRKRLDLAFDLIEQLNRHDDRFRLHVKTAQPQEEKWVWDNEAQRSYFDRVLARVETDPLRSLVTFDGFGPDVANWLRKIGFILSLSDDESFHLAPAEGMVSGSVPIIRNWPGADSVYSSSWVLGNLDEMVERILETVANDDAWEDAAERAEQEAVGQFAFRQVIDQWANLFGRWRTGTLL